MNMAERKKKIKPDTALKTYWNRNGEFADLFNALLYGGRQVIQAEELEERDTESSVILQMDGTAEGMQAVRDLFKVAMKAENVIYVLLGIENQLGIHYAMPIRDLEYCTYSYHKQYEKIKEKYPGRKGLAGNEFLSHMKKSDKLVPVITAVIYYGEEPWDGAKSLYGMMNISEELKPFVSDHKMNLIEAGNTSLAFHNKNNRDLFSLFRLLYDKDNKNREQEAVTYADSNKVDDSVIRAISSAGGIDVEKIEKKGDVAMCTLFEEIEARGEAKGGAKQIIEMGLDFGLSENDILDRMQAKLNIKPEEAREYMEMFGKQTV